MTVTRRTFMQAAGAALAFPAIIPSRVLGDEAPSKQITLGKIGVGIHGSGVNLRNFLAQPDARVLAVCDTFRHRAEKAKQAVDQAYGNSDCKMFQDFRHIITDKAIDAIVISTPDHWHIPMSLMGLDAGKDVFSEKPTKFISEGFALNAAMTRRAAVYQVGLEDRSLQYYHKIVEWCRNGAIGDVERVEVTLPKFAALGPPREDPIPDDLDYNLFCGPAERVPYNDAYARRWWRCVRNFGYGSLLDWGAHLFDTAQLCADAPDTCPVEAEGKGDIPENSLMDVPITFDVNLTYSNGVTVNLATEGTGIKIIGSKGWISSKAWNDQLEASDEAILRIKYKAGESKYHPIPKSEQRNFLDCVKSRQPTTYPASTMHTIHLGLHAADIAMRLGRKVRWNNAASQFVNDPEANALATAPTPRKWES
ncbi:MAG: Gfo/Idh/MocA family oxidoreductase [Kiritimatiellaeota bacterium]|nr:Gfo/Idh/MocA family oxidoreductase [Kiritimatiellota bacterium]